MAMRNLYQILEIPQDADQATIRKSFKKLARKYHPDLNKKSDAEGRFKEVNAAYEVLGDETRRNHYDTFGEASLKPGFNAENARGWRHGSGGFDPGGFGGFSGFDGGGINIDDLLNSFGGRSFNRGQRRPQAQPVVTRGADMEQTLRCSLNDLISAEKKVVTIRRPAACTGCAGVGGTGRQQCPVCAGSGKTTIGTLNYPCAGCSGSGNRFQDECATCEGTGRVMNEGRLKIKLPAGVANGQTIRIRGKGADGKEGGKPGDLLLCVAIDQHPWFERDGANLRLDVPLTIHEAMAGTTVEVPTLSGRLRVKVPPGTMSGQQIRIKNKGLPKKSGKSGSLFLVLQPSPPKTDDAEALSLAQSMDEFYIEAPRGHWKE
jgi:molecular chaperone DnaJ